MVNGHWADRFCFTLQGLLNSDAGGRWGLLKKTANLANNNSTSDRYAAHTTHKNRPESKKASKERSEGVLVYLIRTFGLIRLIQSSTTRSFGSSISFDRFIALQLPLHLSAFWCAALRVDRSDRQPLHPSPGEFFGSKQHHSFPCRIIRCVPSDWIHHASSRNRPPPLSNRH